MILLEPALKTAEDTDNVLKDQKSDNSKETVMEKQEGKEITGRENALKRTYDAVSENGDTVEISEAGRSLQAQENTDGNQYSLSEKKATSDKKLSDAALAGYFEKKLKRLYNSKGISKQQYERAMRRKDAK